MLSTAFLQRFRALPLVLHSTACPSNLLVDSCVRISMCNAYVLFDLDPLDLHTLGVSGFHLGCVGRLFRPPWSMCFVSDFIHACCNAFRWSRFHCLDPPSSCSQPRHGVHLTLSVNVPSRGHLLHPCGLAPLSLLPSGMSGGYVCSSGRFTLLSVMCAGSLDGLVRFVDPSSSFG
ncbi:hypothetical protein OG21DRAFT_1518597, partial [Imleria badia]